jgi:hypothetical protein
MPSEPSRSYMKSIPIVTTYEPELPNKRQSMAPSSRAPSVKRAPSTRAESVRAPTIRAESVRAPTKAESIRGPTIGGPITVVDAWTEQPNRPESVRAPTIRQESVRAPTVRAESVRAPTVRAESVRAPTFREESVRAPREESIRAPTVRAESVRAPTVRSPSRGSVRSPTIRNQELSSPAGSQRHLPLVQTVETTVVGGAAVGEVFTQNRQREMQQRPTSRLSLHDNGVSEGRQTQFSEPQRSASPRPHSPFGHRPQPNLMTVTEEGNDSYGGRESRGAVVRSGTVLSRANTQGRNGTLSRGANGGTVGNRRGAFGRGAGASIGTQPEEVLGRE